MGDVVYRSHGTKGKKYLTIVLGLLQGFMALALGLWQDASYKSGALPAIGTQMALVVLMAIFCEAANGANFALVPHCNSFNNGFMTGLVGAFGNLGGIFLYVDSAPPSRADELAALSCSDSTSRTASHKPGGSRASSPSSSTPPASSSPLPQTRRLLLPSSFEKFFAELHHYSSSRFGSYRLAYLAFRVPGSVCALFTRNGILANSVVESASQRELSDQNELFVCQ